MQKIITFICLFFLIFCTGCENNSNRKTDNYDNILENTEANILGNYLGSEYKGNYIWGAAMNLAWNELNENILHEKLQLNTEDVTALEMVEKFNQSVVSKNDLDAESYYIKSGYGQETVNEINQESRKKFPTKSFADLSLELNPTDIISYAYFIKEVEYLTQFKEKSVNFEDAQVQGFYAYDTQKENVKIVKYWNDEKFILTLQLKDNADQLFLAKGFEISSPQDIVNQINKYEEEEYASINDVDKFEMPKIHLDYHREYAELIDKWLKNANFTEYLIAEMFENIKFDLDEKGARVENEGVISILPGSAEPSKEPKRKEFILDKAFWIIMKKTDSQNPYFLLGINNTELMEKI